MLGRFLRDLWLGPTEEAEWKEINEQLIADSAWRRLRLRLRLWRRLRRNGRKAEP